MSSQLATPPRLATPRAAFSPEDFHAPHSGYRGAPFWSWNGRLQRERLFDQLAVFAAMGLGGAHLHPRTGLATPYLGEDFLQLVRDCADEAQRLGLLTWLYDEDRWPSGAAGGLAVADRAHWTRHLRLTRRRLRGDEIIPVHVHHDVDQPSGERCFVAGWALRFAGGLLQAQRRIGAQDPLEEGEVGLWAWREIPPPVSWFNNRQYLDLLNPEAVARFIAVTHDRYRDLLGERFGGSVPAIFTDEPLFRGMDRPAAWDDERDCCMAWTDDLPDSYRRRFDEELFDVLPRVLFDCADGGHLRARWRFQDHHTERFADGFARQVGDWCERHGLRLTGHMMAEQSLASQTTWVGEVMRSLRHFQLPGIDMLCDQQELLTAKQAQSVARQYGREGVMSELYGVTNWDFPFAGHKRQEDWQAALGITVRVHHLSWYGMAGEAKRDYPASFGRHVPWWREYPAIEDHFARVNVALQTGRPLCRVALLHPIESHWVANGPRAAWADTQRDLEEGLQDGLRWLLEGLIDTDLLAESLLPELAQPGGEAELRVGSMRYQAVVLPPVLSLRRHTVACLQALHAAGGTVLRLGPPPRCFEGEADAELQRIVAAWPELPRSRSALLAAVQEQRELDLRQDGRRVDGVLHQLRETGAGERLCFLCRSGRGDVEGAELALRGSWNLEELDTATGALRQRGAVVEDGWTRLPLDLPDAGHLLLRARPGAPAAAPAEPPRWREIGRLPAPHAVELDEPNVLLLDRGAWRLDDGAWQPEEEVLRIDNLARAALGQEPRHGNIAQPWAEAPRPDEHRITVAYAIDVERPTGSLRLASERLDEARVVLDGEELPVDADGHYVDPDIATIPLPGLTAGSHRLELSWPFGGNAGLEACYLLGDVGVAVAGTASRLVAPPRQLAWGDWTVQGLPFYGGNVVYRCRFAHEGGRLALRVPHVRAPLLAVDLDGERVGRIWRSPWRLELGELAAGEHELALTAFGSRINTLGQLHNCEPGYRWWGPQSWRTTGAAWSDEYQLRPCGVLVAPMLERPDGRS